MEARAKMMGHPVHQMLIVFPLGLLGMSVVFDFVYMGSDDMVFSVVAYWMMVAGIAGGLLAAPFGLIDWSAIPTGTRAKRVGAMHGMGNVVVLLLFIVSVLLRDGAEAPPPASAYLCSFAGVALSLVTAWLGGELVDRLGVGVHDDANLDAPSSLGHTHARADHAPHVR
ncbi:MAG TPA: DUF2231 domain-containing protein [Steroidobacteraceae bacterium]|nr:DUF2231 domain-containing protein [Steroidobacteraceae bacterium]